MQKGSLGLFSKFYFSIFSNEHYVTIILQKFEYNSCYNKLPMGRKGSLNAASFATKVTW